MGLGKFIADRLVSEPFYIVTTKNGHNSIKPITPAETIAYYLRTGSLPRDPKVTLVGSSGSAKGFVGAGVVKKLDEAGIDIGSYIVSSVSSFIAVYEITGRNYKAFEEFILQVPDLIEPLPPPLWVRAAQKIAPKRYSTRLDFIGKFLTSIEPNELKTKDGAMTVNQGLVSTKKLEDRLKEICGNAAIGDIKNLTIMATDYTEEKPVALGRDFPEMPLYKALLASISMGQRMRPIEHNSHLFGDGGYTYHLPLIRELLPQDSKTIICILLASYGERNGRQDYSGIMGFVDNLSKAIAINREVITKLLVENAAQTDISDLIKNGDRKNFRIKLIEPQIGEIPSGTIHIDMGRRLEFIELGYNAAEYALKDFRRTKSAYAQ